MKRIPLEVVKETWEELTAFSEAEAKAAFERFGKHQPFVVAYMLVTEEKLLPKEAEMSLLFIALTVWEIMSSQNPKLAQITGEQIDAAEEANDQYLTDLDDGSEFGFLDAVKELMANYNQTPLLGMVLEVLVEGFGGDPEDADENLGLILMRFKTVIDCLDH